MYQSLKILHLEDVLSDADMVSHALSKSGFPYTLLHVDGREKFIDALENFLPDIIVSDHSLPNFDSHEALQILKDSGKDTPFILVTATVSEEYAVSIIQDGAADYILKDRLQRLPTAILAAMDKVKAARELAEQKKLQEKMVMQKGLESRENERHEIGMELHDNISQVLAAAKLYIQSAMKHMETGKEKELLQKGEDYILNAIAEIRRLSHTLVTPSLTAISLADAVSELIEDIRATTALTIKLQVDKELAKELDEPASLMIYRIVQEQMSNIIKHAKASTVMIALGRRGLHLSLKVTDNGIGFDTAMTGRGIGLRNINDRAGFYDGSVDVVSSPGNGCSIEVMIPLTEKLIQSRYEVA